VNLRTKTFLTVGGITALLVVVLVMAVNRLVLRRFESLEREQAEESLLRVRNLLLSELDHLAGLAGDWGSRAAAPGIPEGAFAESIPEPAMARHRVDLILLFDPDGQPAFRRMRAEEPDAGVTDSVLSRLGGAEGALCRMVGTHRLHAGFLDVEGDLWAFSCRAVGGGDRRANLIVGRRIDEAEINRLQRLSKAVFTIRNVPYGLKRNDRASTIPIIQAIDDVTLTATASLFDLTGEPRLKLRLEQPRLVYQQGLAAMHTLIGWLAGMALLLACTILFATERHLVSRIDRLGRQIREIEVKGRATGEVETDGGDELSALAMRINRMLRSIRRTEDALLESESMYRGLIDSLPMAVLVVQDRVIAMANVTAARMFRATGVEDLRGADPLDWVAESERAVFRRTIEQKTAPGDSHGWTLDMVRSNGEVFPAHLFLSYVHFGGRDAAQVVILDVTERKQFERALEESEEKYRKLIAGASDAILIADPETGILLEVNQKACELTGYAEEELVGRHQASLHPARDRERYLALFKRSAHGALGLQGTDLRIVRRDGAEIPVDISANLIALKDRSLVLGLFRDLSERRQAEQERAMLTEALNAAANGVLIADARGLIQWVNPAFTRISGYEASDVIGRTPRALKSDEHGDAFYRSMWNTILRGDVWFGEVINRHKSGHHYVEEQMITPLRLGSDEITHFIAIKQDVTNRKRAQSMLTESEDRYQELFNNISSGVFVLDRAEAEPRGFRILDVNRAGLQIDGWMHRDMLGRALAAAWPEAEGGALGAALERVWETGETEHIEALRVERGEARAWREYQIYRLPSDRLVVVVDDITRAKETQSALQRKDEELRQAQKMEAIGRLAGGLAHDFNNILTVVNGLSEILLMTADPSNPLRPDIEEINRAGNKASALTQQLLTFSRKQVIEPDVMDINRVIKSLRSLLERLLGEHIELVDELQKNLWPVRADMSQMEQVVMNLVVNARDAMAEGGTLTIATANLSGEAVRNIRESPPVDLPTAEYVLLSVRDTGCGMDAQTLQQAFEPFFTTKEEGKGTGLGLSTTYGIVKQNGGRIQMISEPGRGTECRIFLPRSDSVTAAKPAARPAEALPSGTETILVVEDEDMLRRLVVRLLEQAGFRVLAAANGEEALSLANAEEGTIDLLLTDVVMPGLNGYELKERLAALRGDMKVMYVTGYTDNEVITKQIAREGSLLMEKPFTVMDLAWKVRRVLDGRSPA
jgi:two-component system, cell cycle sensor histidine kinase and response regulator CckA